MGEFGDGDDDEHGSGEDGTDEVDGEASPDAARIRRFALEQA